MEMQRWKTKTNNEEAINSLASVTDRGILLEKFLCHHHETLISSLAVVELTSSLATTRVIETGN